MLISQFAPTSVKISEHSDQYCGCYSLSLPIVNLCDNAPSYNDKGLLIFTMSGIRQILQLQSDGSEIFMGINVCAGHYKSWFIRVVGPSQDIGISTPHTTVI